MSTQTVDRPNILLLMTDQHRFDALTGGGLQADTPYLNALRTQGVDFPHAYSACPVCIPARRTLLSGQTPAHHGILANEHHEQLHGVTLPEALMNAGYQTHLCGKIHLFPGRKLYGFMSADWADGAHQSEPGQPENDYDRWLREQGLYYDAGFAHGANQNGFVARPFHMEERYHFTNWCVDRALRFLERRDPTAPFFLNVSFHQPHGPCTPPRWYFDKYLQKDLPAPAAGDWDDTLPSNQQGEPVTAYRVNRHAGWMRELRAGYLGCVEHIDHQIGRLLDKLPANTIVLFCSDHGDMLGDHGWIRKRNAYEGSAHVPMFINLPREYLRKWGVTPGTACQSAVELMDVMPTILDMAGVPVPETVDGLSLLPAMRGEKLPRAYVHGECCAVPSLGSGMQYLTDGREKYIWFPGLGREQLFDLTQDPHETHDLANDNAYAGALARWRERLTAELRDRPEGFVQNGVLQKLPGVTAKNINPGSEEHA